jgi:hypothetical protein
MKLINYLIHTIGLKRGNCHSINMEKYKKKKIKFNGLFGKEYTVIVNIKKKGKRYAYA